MGVFKIVAFVLPVLVAYCWLRGDGFDAESVRGKRVLVTGASSGIGEKIAYRYAELGAKLLITARRAELLDKVAEKCRQLGAAQVSVAPADMAKPNDRKNVVDKMLKEFGGVDVLILNHAVMRYAWWKGTPGNMTVLEDMMNINFMSFVDITSQLLKPLEESRGYIGVVSSVAGKLGSPGMTHYCANKHALQGFYGSLRQELKARKTGVSVTVAVYGPVDSDRALELVKEIPTPVDFKSMAGSTAQAADVFVRGVGTRAFEIYYPTMATAFTLLHRIAPETLENFASSFALEN